MREQQTCPVCNCCVTNKSAEELKIVTEDLTDYTLSVEMSGNDSKVRELLGRYNICEEDVINWGVKTGADTMSLAFIVKYSKNLKECK